MSSNIVVGEIKASQDSTPSCALSLSQEVEHSAKRLSNTFERRRWLMNLGIHWNRSEEVRLFVSQIMKNVHEFLEQAKIQAQEYLRFTCSIVHPPDDRALERLRIDCSVHLTANEACKQAFAMLLSKLQHNRRATPLPKGSLPKFSFSLLSPESISTSSSHRIIDNLFCETWMPSLIATIHTDRLNIAQNTIA